MKYIIPAFSLGMLLVLVFGLSYILYVVRPAYGSSVQGNDYQATSTAASTMFGATISGDRLIKTGYGSLGSVVITGANTGIVNLYNATTTNVDLRTGNKATSTILIASIPASLAAGTYVFDAEFTDGLYLDIYSGNMPTSTVTWR